VSAANFDAIFSLNVRAAFFVAQAVVRRLLEGKRPGSIINVSSQMGHVGAVNRTVYCASKHALEGMTKAMAVELAAHGIRVNTLTPGGNESGQNETFKKNYSARVPLGRMGNPPEMVGAVVYLASDAASYVTGQNIAVDGGWTAW